MNEVSVSESRQGLPVNANETEGKYLTFWTAGQLIGVPISEVVQIVGMQKVTEIPDYPPYAKGIINLRGTIIPVIDIRLRLGKPAEEYTDRTCVIVSNIGNRDFGFIVDGVDEVADISDKRISQPPQVGTEMVNRYLTGIARLGECMAEKIVLLIDTKKILGESEFNMPAQSAL